MASSNSHSIDLSMERVVRWRRNSSVMSFLRDRSVGHSSIKIIAVFIAVLALCTAVRAQGEAPTAQEAIELFNRGQDEHAKGEFLKAIENYDKALRLLPEFVEAEYQKGNAYLSLGKPSEAETAFRRAVDLRGDWTLALVALGTVLERRGEFAEGEKLLNKAIELDDSSFPAFSALAELRLKTKASKDTLKTLLSKVRIFSSKANATSAVFATQAMLENALGDRTSARKSVARALSLDPESKPALYEKAEVALSDGDYVLAEEVIRSIERVDPKSESVILLRARLMVANDRVDDARKLVSTLDSPSPDAKELAGKIELMAAAAPDILETALERNPNDTFILGRLCSMYRVRSPEKALDLCKRGLDAEPANLNFAIGYGGALVQAKRFDDAVTVLRRLTQSVPDNSTVHANLGTALFQLKRFSEAKAEFQWLTTRQPTPPIAYFFLAICHDELGEYLDAGANYDLFLKFADAEKNRLEIDQVKLRLPLLEKQIKQLGSKSKSKNGE
jgi:tetratricopeptide (TPR) repeat protein